MMSVGCVNLIILNRTITVVARRLMKVRSSGFSSREGNVRHHLTRTRFAIKVFDIIWHLPDYALY